MKALFPLFRDDGPNAGLVYLDSAATAQRPEAVLEAPESADDAVVVESHDGIAGSAGRGVGDRHGFLVTRQVGVEPQAEHVEAVIEEVGRIGDDDETDNTATRTRIDIE